MNAGAYGGETKDVLDWADVFQEGKVVRMHNDVETLLDVETLKSLRLAYRRSVLQDHPDWVVLRAGYTLEPGNPGELKASIKEFRAQRMTAPPTGRAAVPPSSVPRGLPRPRHRGGRAQGRGWARSRSPGTRQLPGQPGRRHSQRSSRAHRAGKEKVRERMGIDLEEEVGWWGSSSISARRLAPCQHFS